MADSTSTPGRGAHLLVPVDFSPPSRAALRRAAEMIRGVEGGKLTLLSVVEPATSGLRIQTSDLHRQLQTETEQQLQQLVREEVPDRPDTAVAVTAGRPADEICAEAARRGADMIVIATHGRTGLKHYLLGSVAESVVRQASCPVLVFR